MDSPAETNGNGNGNSKLLGVSIRAWLALITVLTVCSMELTGIEVTEPLYTLAVAIVAFYFGGHTPSKP